MTRNTRTAIEKQRSTDRFMELVGISRDWFSDEEIPTSDLSLGRMASRLQDFESQIKQSLIQEIREKLPNKKGHEFEDCETDIRGCYCHSYLYNQALDEVLTILEEMKTR